MTLPSPLEVFWKFIESGPRDRPLFHYHICVRLTWWDWDWDAVEPFSFVFMFSLLIAGFAYFVVTKKDLTFEGARRRAFNILFTRCLFCAMIISFLVLTGRPRENTSTWSVSRNSSIKWRSPSKFCFNLWIEKDWSCHSVQPFRIDT